MGKQKNAALTKGAPNPKGKGTGNAERKGIPQTGGQGNRVAIDALHASNESESESVLELSSKQFDEESTLDWASEDAEDPTYDTKAMDPSGKDLDEKNGIDTSHPERFALELQDGRFTWASTNVHFEEDSDNTVDNPDWSNRSDDEMKEGNAYTFAEKERTLRLRMSKSKARKEAAAELRNSPRLIYIMDGSGHFFAGEGHRFVVHHSSLAGGGQVAAAGEMGLAGGVPNYLNDMSGHYMPSPYYTLQAVEELSRQGVSTSGLTVELHGLSEEISGDWFLGTFSTKASFGQANYLDEKDGLDQIKRVRQGQDPVDAQFEVRETSRKLAEWQARNDDNNNNNAREVQTESFMYDHKDKYSGTTDLESFALYGGDQETSEDERMYGTDEDRYSADPDLVPFILDEEELESSEESSEEAMAKDAVVRVGGPSASGKAYGAYI